MKPRRFTKFWIRPYGPSNTAELLAAALNGKRLKLEGSQYHKKNGHVLINWGGTDPLPDVDLNDPMAVRVAVSKMDTFRVLQSAQIPHPEWTRNKLMALLWGNEVKIVGRDKDKSRGGEGITVYQKGDQLGEHLFYAKYFKKAREFRIHVVGGAVIFEQEKLKKKGFEGADKYVRSHDRGWCFAFKHLADNPIPAGVRLAAVAAIKAVGLDFGAVDIGWNPDDGPCVFEVNTAPGLEESALDAYVEAFKQI